MSAETTRFLEGQKIEWTGCPPFSPDLVSKYFYLFPSAKNKLRGQRFSSREEAVGAFKVHVKKLPQSEWKKCYKNWFQHMQKWVDLHGEYFKKQ
ncbi:Histone-lysine N-methyltransferase SETMAR [Eumeta japonica]|uniref:Histone-lysine N-methyltransferase SETMAR n=1 Tax=Eumeta variegata TaxID=151549 RepID=A0A4C1SUL3_EUMVA|nr:Histone-lysine N-methyltransferase SETMAR [Eumeta japonica]